MLYNGHAVLVGSMNDNIFPMGQWIIDTLKVGMAEFTWHKHAVTVLFIMAYRKCEVYEITASLTCLDISSLSSVPPPSLPPNTGWWAIFGGAWHLLLLSWWRRGLVCSDGLSGTLFWSAGVAGGGMGVGCWRTSLFLVQVCAADYTNSISCGSSHAANWLQFTRYSSNGPTLIELLFLFSRHYYLNLVVLGMQA